MEIPSLILNNSQLKAQIVSHLEPLIIGNKKLSQLREVFVSELEKGLENGLSSSSVQMENTYIPQLLNGTEEGFYLALDLGGTNFRVISIQMKAGRIVEEKISYYRVEEKLRLGPGLDLFDFLASCIKDFMVNNSLSAEEKFSLGFTFSFPMIQHALNIGVLVNWTKSFNCPGVIGEDAVKLLNTSLNKVGLSNVEVVAILNDTTGTLVAGAHDYPDCAIGLILGTGTNGAYIEKAERIIRWESGTKEGVKEVLIDPEWGAFGDNGCINFIKTDWDRTLDENSLLPGSFTYEKYFAGKYMGELTRLIFLSVAEAGLVGGAVPAQLKVRDCITTEDVSGIVQDCIDGNVEKTKLTLTKLGCAGSEEEVKVLWYICNLLAERGGLLVAVPMATFLDRMDRKSTTIGITGSLYKLHPTFGAILERQIRAMSSKPFQLGLCDDGSGKGAGLVAAIAQRLRQT